MVSRFSLLIAIGCFLVDSVVALPRFASRTNFSCKSCHVNPTGGGMRSPFGNSYGREELPIPTWQEQFALDEFNTNLTDFLSYGADVRFLYFYQSKDDGSADRSSFFPMQADVYLNLQLSRKISVFVNPAFGPFPRYEVFGLAKVLPAGGYVKVGRFTPSYSMRLDDHTSYVREATPFRNNSGQQAGIELGIYPEPIGIVAAITNGVSGDRASDVSKALYGRVDGRVKIGPAGIMLGASAYRDNTAGGRLTLLSGFGGVSFGEAFTVLAEVQHMKGTSTLMSVSSDRNQRNSAGIELKQLALFTELSWAIMQGIDLKFMYDFFDPDVDIKSGRAERLSFGLEFFPVSGVELRPLIRFTNDTKLNTNITDFHLMMHFYL